MSIIESSQRNRVILVFQHSLRIVLTHESHTLVMNVHRTIAKQKRKHCHLDPSQREAFGELLLHWPRTHTRGHTHENPLARWKRGKFITYVSKNRENIVQYEIVMEPVGARRCVGRSMAHYILPESIFHRQLHVVYTPYVYINIRATL